MTADMAPLRPLPRFAPYASPFSSLPNTSAGSDIAGSNLEHNLAVMIGEQNVPMFFDSFNSVENSNFANPASFGGSQPHPQPSASSLTTSQFGNDAICSYPNSKLQIVSLACPRSYSPMRAMGAPLRLTPPSYPPSAYQLEPCPPLPGSDFAESLPQQMLERSVCQMQNRFTELSNPLPAPSRHIEEGDMDSRNGMSIPQSPAGSAYDVDSNIDELLLEKEEPYAKLIWRCLLEAPDHTMVLRDIYDWFRKNTDKGKDPNTKGWQNSIRHNLSMNKAFDKIEVPAKNGQKKGFVWRLSKLAQRDGVQSTTRFRNKQPSKRSSKGTNPLGYRQAAGAKGGAMARHAALLRRSERHRKELERRRLFHETPGQGLDPIPYGSIPSPIDFDDFSTIDLKGSPFPPYYHHDSADTLASGRSVLVESSVTYATPMSEQSYPGTPLPTADIHFLSLEGHHVFYDSSETDSQPCTPDAFGAIGSFGDVAMDPTVFLADRARREVTSYAHAEL